MADDKRTSLLRSFEDGWRPFWSLVEALDSDALRDHPAGNEWPIGLILAHCARWEDWTYETVAARLRDGAAPSMAGAEDWNERWAREDRDVAPEAARHWLGESHERLRLLIEGLNPEQWDEVVIRTIDWCTFHHYAEHLGDLPDQR